MSAADKYRSQIRENAPVVFKDMTFHPLPVRKYELYALARPSFEIMQSSLAPKLARLPWCACLWALDEECFEATGKWGEFLTRALLVLAEALRLEVYADAGSGGRQEFPLRPVFDKDALKGVMVGRPPHVALLNLRDMSEVREIIAAQNAYDIPDETWNPELVRAAQKNASRGGGSLEFDLEALVASVALHWRCRVADIYQWPIREFQAAQAAIDRTLNYQIYTLAEKAGFVRFEHGNPFPSWRFDMRSELPTGFRSIADIDAGAKGLIAGV